MKNHFVFIAILAMYINSNLVSQTITSQSNQPVEVNIDINKVINTMAGGIGASWHAMGPDVIHYPDLIGRDNRACKGSAYGGNPPVIPAFDKAWDDVCRHARWLGMDFIRVEIAMSMYNPEREKYVWDNDEMKTLYRILDHCQKNDVDVYMTMQWNGVAWNAHPGVNRLQSGPKSATDFAVSYSTLVEYLVKNKGYTCIHWLTVNNEPGMGVGWWQGPDGKPESIMPAFRAMRAELDKRGLKNIAMCGSDGHGIHVGNFDPNDPTVGALSTHCYWGKPAEMFKEGLEFKNRLKIPYFIAEMGTFFMGNFEGENMAMGGPRSEAPKSYDHQMINAEKIIGGINMGVDGFNRWSFVNRGDLDGQWQLIRTWNPNLWDFKKNVEPEPIPYYTFGIITRFAAKHSLVIDTKSNHSSIIAATLRSPKGQISLFIINLSNEDMSVNINFTKPDKTISLKRYFVTEQLVKEPNFIMGSNDSILVTPKIPSIKARIPAKSITTYTTYNLAPDADGIMSEQKN